MLPVNQGEPGVHRLTPSGWGWGEEGGRAGLVTFPTAKLRLEALAQGAQNEGGKSPHGALSAKAGPGIPRVQW